MAVEIKYWERSAWSSYFRDHVLPLYQSSLTIMNIWRKLVDTAHGKLLSTVVEDRPGLESAFAGGTSPPDKYEEGSLALIYKTLLGASVKLREYYFLKAHGKPPRTICTVSRTDVLNYVDHMSTLLERVLTRVCGMNLVAQVDVENAREGSEKVALEVLANPESLPGRVVDLLDKALRLTVAYNEYTRFVWHLRKIPKKYIEEFYPEMLKPEVFKFIRELLGLSEYMVPQVEDPEIADLYTIFSFDYAVIMSFPTQAGYARIDGTIYEKYYEYFRGGLSSNYEPYNTVGGCLCRINELVWGLFRYAVDSLKLVISGEAPRPLEEWSKIAVSEPPLYSTLNYPSSYEDLSMLDECLPAVFVGMAELVKLEGENRLYLARRW